MTKICDFALLTPFLFETVQDLATNPEIFNIFKCKEILPKLGVGLHVFHMMDSTTRKLYLSPCAAASDDASHKINRVCSIIPAEILYLF